MNLYERAWNSAGGAASYERGRPGYAEQAVDFLAEALGLGTRSTILDVGAGTGKLTRQLLHLRATVVAVEPLAEMRAQFRASVPGVPVLEGRAEALPVEPQSVDAIVAAQAWHWFDSEAATAEAERVLRPGGGIGLLWNEYDVSVPWIADLARVRDASALKSPSHATNDWRRAFDERPRWEPLGETSFGHEQVLAPAQVVERMTSSSVIAALPADDRARVGDSILEILGRYPETQGASSIRLRYRTEVFWSKFRADDQTE